MADCINEIDFDNQFSVRSVDLDTFDFPKLRVRTWSDLFGKGGSYAIEPVDGSAHAGRIIAVQIEADDRHLRAEMQALVDDWNDDPRTNWLRILHRAAVKVAAYEAKQVAGFDKLVAASAKADAQLATIAAFRELDALA